MKKKLLSSTLLTAMVLSLVTCGAASVSAAETPEAAESSPASATDSSSEDTGEAPDYSQEDCWLQIPEITKDIDTFYIYSTVYIESSFEEGAPAYAELDNPEMILGASGEYVTNASAFEDSTNVFVPLYRQAGMPTMKKAWKETGNCDAAIASTPFPSASLRNSPFSLRSLRAFHCLGLWLAVRMIPPAACSPVTANSVVGVEARPILTTS